MQRVFKSLWQVCQCLQWLWISLHGILESTPKEIIFPCYALLAAIPTESTAH